MGSARGNGAAASFEGSHPRYGLPSKLAAYRDEAGEVLFFVAEYGNGKRCPWSYDGKQWRQQSAAKPYPLYRLPELAASDAAAIILPDESTADAFSTLIAKPVASCCFGGAKGIADADLRILAGKRVRIWLRAGAEGRKASRDLSARLTGIAASVAVVDTEGEEEGFSPRTLIENGLPIEALAHYMRERLVAAAEFTGTTWAGQTVGPPLLTHQPTEPEERRTGSAGVNGHAKADTGKAVTVGGEAQRFERPLDCWQHFNLALNASNVPYPNIDNVQRVLALDPETSGRFAFDEFSGRIRYDGKLWIADRSASTLTTKYQRELYLPLLRTPTVIEAIGAYSEQRKCNAVKEYLEALPRWDGEARIERFLICGYGATDSPYTRACGRLFLVSAIARIYEPGVLVRSMIVLEGAQEAGKTSSLHDLADPWVLENSRALDSEKFEQSIQGYWIIELAELASMIRSDVEAVKATLTRRDDVYRAPYGRSTYPHPRQCVFVGTTNLVSWQVDETGGTRYLPVECTAVDRSWIQASRAQLWAEALAFYRLGACWWEMPREAAQVEQEARRAVDAWEETVHTLMDLKRESGIRVDEIFGALDLEMRDRHHGATQRVTRILSAAQWRVRVEKIGHKSVRIWRPLPL